MEKRMKRYIVVTAIIFAITCVATVVFVYNVSHLSVGTVEIIRTILNLIFLLIAVAMIVYFVICGILIMKRGIHNIKKCDDEIFRKIDQYKKCWGEDKHYYIKQIQIINLYYEEGGKRYSTKAHFMSTVKRLNGLGLWIKVTNGKVVEMSFHS